MKILSYRTTMPFQNRDVRGNPSISPTTDKSILPTNNVPTIQDFLSGEMTMEDILPHGGGDWSPGKDVSKSYRETGDDYKRKERDLEIFNKILPKEKMPQERWKVKVNGGALTFVSFPLAEQYMRQHKIPFKYLSRVAQNNNIGKVNIIGESLHNVFLVESIDVKEGVIENGAAFCVFPKHFITCAHVIKSYNKNKPISEKEFLTGRTVNLIQNGAKYPVTVKAADPKLDIALLVSEVDADPIPIDSNIVVGDDIFTIGSPHGYENHVSSGVVGSLHRKPYRYNGAPEYMFVDLSVFPGNSGGPVIRENNGAVIGLITLIISATGASGLNAALPSNYIEKFCKQNIENF